MLCLLTLVDIGAVSPGTLTPWKEDLLWEVFVRTYNELTHGYGDSTIAAGEAALAALESGRPPDLAADELSRVLEGFPRRYLTSVDPAQIYRHVRLARDLRHDEVHLLLDRRGDAWELAVVALDKPHLFSNICGTLAFCGMDILRGSAMTSRSGLVLDIFHFVDGEQFFDRNADGPARFEALLQDVVQRQRLAAVRPRGAARPRRAQARTVGRAAAARAAPGPGAAPNLAVGLLRLRPARVEILLDGAPPRTRRSSSPRLDPSHHGPGARRRRRGPRFRQVHCVGRPPCSTTAILELARSRK